MLNPTGPSARVDPGSGILPAHRFGSVLRRIFTVLVAAAMGVAVYHHLRSSIGVESATGGPSAANMLLAFPAVLAALATLVGLTLSSASRHGLNRLQSLHVRQPSQVGRASMNGLIWFTLAWLCVDATALAFAPSPLGAEGSALVLAAVLGYGTYRLHRVAIDHDAYRSFNLVAMLLAAGSLAAMSSTGTGAWWTVNFSTLGTSDDFAAVCFNVGIIVAGAGMALLGGGLTRALSEARFRARPGAVAIIRMVIALLGISLIGVGLVPIDTHTVLHNVFACSAATLFAMLAAGARSLVRGLPVRLRILSAVFLAIEGAAFVCYDSLGLLNLTVFEIIAFSLVFAWLIALVVCTTTHVDTTTDASERHVVPSRSTAQRKRARASGPLSRPRTVTHVPSNRSRASARSRAMAYRTHPDDDDLPGSRIAA